MAEQKRWVDWQACYEEAQRDVEHLTDSLHAAEERLAEADKANQLLRADLAAAGREEDLILNALRLDPARYRTECGYLNVPKIIAAIKNPDVYPRTADREIDRE